MLELDGDFFGRKKKCMGAGISGGELPWAHEAAGRALGPHGQVLAPPAMFSVPDILKYSRKNHMAFGELLFSGIFFVAWIIQKTDRKYYFFFIYSK